MSSSEFTRIVCNLSQLGESVRIEVSKDKEGVRFASEGEAFNIILFARCLGFFLMFMYVDIVIEYINSDGQG